jgi:hypothetical protein
VFGEVAAAEWKAFELTGNKPYNITSTTVSEGFAYRLKTEDEILTSIMDGS